jgi:hypothetical protein
MTRVGASEPSRTSQSGERFTISRLGRNAAFEGRADPARTNHAWLSMSQLARVLEKQNGGHQAAVLMFSSKMPLC